MLDEVLEALCLKTIIRFARVVDQVRHSAVRCVRWLPDNLTNLLAVFALDLLIGLALHATLCKRALFACTAGHVIVASLDSRQYCQVHGSARPPAHLGAEYWRDCHRSLDPSLTPVPHTRVSFLYTDVDKDKASSSKSSFF